MNNIEEKPKKQKTNENDYAFKEGFEYDSTNPYHDRLKIFEEFVLRDSESEVFRGKWNQEVFEKEQDIHVEIGTGYGKFMHEYCLNNPEVNFVGLDHRFKRSFNLAKKLSTIENKNFRYLRARGERLEFMFGENEITKLFYFFPDPWPKARHHKKRLFQKRFLDSAHLVLKNGGEIQVKTDHDGYFEWMLEALQNETRFETIMKSHDLRAEHPEHFLASFETEFEKIFLGKGIKIKAMVLKNKK